MPPSSSVQGPELLPVRSQLRPTPSGCQAAQLARSPPSPPCPPVPAGTWASPGPGRALGFGSGALPGGYRHLCRRPRCPRPRAQRSHLSKCARPVPTSPAPPRRQSRLRGGHHPSPGGPQPSACGASTVCGATAQRSDCMVDTTGCTARIAHSLRTGTTPPGASVIAGPLLPASSSPAPPVRRACGPQRPSHSGRALPAPPSPGWAQGPNHTPTRCPHDAGSSPRPRLSRSTAGVRRRVSPKVDVTSASSQYTNARPHPTQAPSQVGAPRPRLPLQRPSHGGRPSGAASVPGRSATSRLELLTR